MNNQNFIKIYSALFLAASFLWLLLAAPVQAAAPSPCDGEFCTPSAPPLVGKEPAPEEFSIQIQSIQPQAVALPSLKAVLVVGPIDGDAGAWTQAEIANMELAAAELTKNGVQVTKFYTPNNDWTQIAAASQGAHFFAYRGHGVYMTTTPWTVGGFYLKDKFVSSDDIRRDLRLAQNAVVMLYGCFTAGSSSIDPGGEITLQEAQRRVAQYSDAFLDIGAAGYYADWYGSAFKYFITDLFAGKTLEQAYKSFNFSSATLTTSAHPDHPEASLWVDRHYVYYDHAFVGQPTKTLNDLFGSRMEVGSDSVYSVATPTSSDQVFAIPITSTPSAAFAWSVTPTDVKSWMELSKSSGLAGEDLVVTLKPGGQTPGVYSTQLTITGTAPSLLEAQQSISVTLAVVDLKPYVFLPFAMK